MNTWIIGVGSMTRGYDFYGPFETEAAARRWATHPDRSFESYESHECQATASDDDVAGDVRDMHMTSESGARFRDSRGPIIDTFLLSRLKATPGYVLPDYQKIVTPRGTALYHRLIPDRMRGSNLEMIQAEANRLNAEPQIGTFELQLVNFNAFHADLVAGNAEPPWYALTKDGVVISPLFGDESEVYAYADQLGVGFQTIRWTHLEPGYEVEKVEDKDEPQVPREEPSA